VIRADLPVDVLQGLAVAAHLVNYGQSCPLTIHQRWHLQELSLLWFDQLKKDQPTPCHVLGTLLNWYISNQDHHA